MIRVLMIVPRFESTGRGVEVFARYLANGLDSRRFNITILSGPHASNIAKVDCVEFPLIKREKLSQLFGFFLKYFPARLGCSAVDLETLSLMWRARHFLRDKSFHLIIPIGGTWSYRFANYYKKKAKIISIGQAGPVKNDLLLSDTFIALTPTDQEIARHLAPKVRGTVISNGVDPHSFYPPKHLSEKKREKIILCVAAFTVDKRQDLLLDALEFLDSNIRCILVGNGPQKNNLSSHPQVKLGRVEFLELPHNQMPELYRRVDVFTLPALNEAFGIVFVEALASGLAVVANDGPRQRYVIGESGIFCDVTNPREYANALHAALALPYNEQRIEQAKKFSWVEIIGQYQALLEEINGRIRSEK
jgi:glycosyltransferase involved in cell wall biosynthesis